MRQRKGERLPSYDELLAAVYRVVEHDKITPAAIAGGLAMQIWGSSRLTGDLDIVAENVLGYDGEALSFGGVRTKEGNIDLDVIVRNDEFRDLYEAALDEGTLDLEGIPLPVVVPEYLVAMKMVAGRTKDEGDVRFLVLQEDFDLEKAEQIVREHLGRYAVRELRSIIDEAKWRRSRGDE
jgi:hypothetical protein